MWGKEKTVKRYLKRCADFGPLTNGIAMRLLDWSGNPFFTRLSLRLRLGVLIIMGTMEKYVEAICGTSHRLPMYVGKNGDSWGVKPADGLEADELPRQSQRSEL